MFIPTVYILKKSPKMRQKNSTKGKAQTMKNLLLATILATFCLVTTASAQYWSDDASASDYDPGWIDGFGATPDLSPWMLIDIPGTGSVTHQAITALSVGGHPVMNTSDRAWVTTMTNPAGVCYWEGRRYWGGAFPAVSTGKIFVDMQMVSTLTGGSQHIIAIEGDSAICASIATQTGFTWFINGSIDTGIPGALPIRIEYTFVNPATFDIKVTDLSGTFPPFTSSGVPHMGADIPTSIHFLMNDTIVGDQSAMIINNLTVDPLGTLPVELDFFMVE
jgi:hypothetical protein